MPKWPWIERKFNFDYPAGKWPDLLARVRGTPARIEELVRGLDPTAPARQPDDGWSIQQNVGHLIVVEDLHLCRIDEILDGKDVLTAADMTNRRSNEADFSARDFADLLAEFRTARARLVARFESLDESDWAKSAQHPRLNQPMRIVDIACFTAEHDDYHVARIHELVGRLT